MVKVKTNILFSRLTTMGNQTSCFVLTVYLKSETMCCIMVCKIVVVSGHLTDCYSQKCFLSNKQKVTRTKNIFGNISHSSIALNLQHCHIPYIREMMVICSGGSGIWPLSTGGGVVEIHCKSVDGWSILFLLI